ncbi:hypothetical protein CO662_22030 [Rhizobium anhuiense]|uniref:Lysozyme n=1 Tax=Rhizobium anhuiense TaxID=1184720 RepID=A0ABX4J3I4_9HYPH|nr:GH25 family lysozyme [Rhizobium anhuiense]PDS49753.1 hypothetical protein CO662_22030 [Rhizobium anhuiense]
MVIRRYPSQRFIKPYLLLALALACVPRLASSESGKRPLTDDPSRGELFEMMGEELQKTTPASEFSQFAFRANFRFPHDALWKNPSKEEYPRTNQTFGIDVSHHTTDDCKCRIGWSRIAEQKVAFAYLKATQGVDYFDRSFRPNVEALRALPADKKIAIGAYHFLSADGSAEDQAENFLEVVRKQLGADDLTPSLDLEWDVRVKNGKTILAPDGRPLDFWMERKLSGPEILNRVHSWLRIIEETTGKKPLVYTSQTWWNERMGGVGSIEQALAGYRIWITDLSSKGLKVEQPYVYKGKWHLFQFTFTASADKGGLPAGKKVDANVFEGDVSKLLASLK